MRCSVLFPVTIAALYVLSGCNTSGKFPAETFVMKSDAVEVPAKQEVELLSVPEYVDWIDNKENGFRSEKTIGDLTFMLQYKPHEYILSSEDQESEISTEALKNRLEQIKGL